MTDVVPPEPAAAPEPAGSPVSESASDQPGPRRRWWHRAPQSRRTPDRPCLNCGNETVGFFCPHCGQRKVDMRVSLRRMMMEVIDDQLSVNSTLPRTLGALFFRPGRLTQEYVAGRVVRYIPPFRLYLVSSLLFFILLPLVPGVMEVNVSEDDVRQADSIRVALEVDSVLLARARAAGQDTTPFVHQRPRGEASGNVHISPPPDSVPWLLRPLARRGKQTEERLNAMSPRDAVGTLRDSFLENAPTGIFLIMPLFALILKLLYARRKRFYVEHFVFALHVHSLAFLLLTAMVLAQQDWLAAVLMVGFMIWLYLAMKRVYGQGWFKTLIKYLLLGQAYMIILIFGVLATAVLTALSV
jgi:hypothetical protein